MIRNRDSQLPNQFDRTARITRRTCLSSIAAGTAFATTVRLPAAVRDLVELKFIVVSDTHLGYRDQDAAAKQWSQMATELKDVPGEFVLHLGDIVDGGRESQYPLYLAARELIGKPVHEIPGNHDPSELFEKHLRQPIDMSVDYHWLRLVLLNNSHTDSHDGFLMASQLEWLDEQCRQAASKNLFVLLAMHVPAHKNAHPDRGWYVKPTSGQTELYALLERHRGRVLATFHGHFHNGLRGWDDHSPIHEICFPSALYNQDRKLTEQNAPGYNLTEFRPGYTQVTIRNGTMILRYHPLGVAGSVEKECRCEPLTNG